MKGVSNILSPLMSVIGLGKILETPFITMHCYTTAPLTMATSNTIELTQHLSRIMSTITHRYQLHKGRAKSEGVILDWTGVSNKVATKCISESRTFLL